jgi:hypothetical protein|tara:strand:+ start:775 stop:906 length:132 start_codon:yes stop_codon:yes gene_type:complete
MITTRKGIRMKRFAYEMVVANVVMVLALMASGLIWVVWTSLVG